MSESARPYPSFPPFFRAARSARLQAMPCAECAAPGPHDAELLHLTLLESPGGTQPLTMASIYRLCPRCVQAARRQGWPALADTWRDISTAPQGVAGLARAKAEGGVH